MELMFKVKYDDGRIKFDGLDMYYGSHSLTAISEILLLSLHASIHGEVVVQAPAAKGFRLVLKKSQEGSLEQYIQLLVTDPETISLLTDLTKNGIYDVVKYLLSSCLGILYIIQNRKAKKKYNKSQRRMKTFMEDWSMLYITLIFPLKTKVCQFLYL
jgi:hypothetical protein